MAQLPALPSELSYLNESLEALWLLDLDELYAIVEFDILDEALKKRVRDLDEDSAITRIQEDSEHLQTWSESLPERCYAAEHISELIVFRLEDGLFAEIDADGPGPRVLCDFPAEWKVQTFPYQTRFEFGKVVGQLTALSEMSWRTIQMEADRFQKAGRSPGRVLAFSAERSEVRRDVVNGFKQVEKDTADPNRQWLRVRYLLEVPGGRVQAEVMTVQGIAFDVNLLDTYLDTIQVIGEFEDYWM